MGRDGGRDPALSYFHDQGISISKQRGKFLQIDRSVLQREGNFPAAFRFHHSAGKRGDLVGD